MEENRLDARSPLGARLVLGLLLLTASTLAAATSPASAQNENCATCGGVTVGQACPYDYNGSGDGEVCTVALCVVTVFGEDGELWTSGNQGVPCDGGISGGAAWCSYQFGSFPRTCPADDNPCDAELCNKNAGGCTHVNREDLGFENWPCDDDLYCTGEEYCRLGICHHQNRPCDGIDGDSDCTETCNENGKHCNDPDVDEDGAAAACDDGDSCNGDNDYCAYDESGNYGCFQSLGTDPCAGLDTPNECHESCRNIEEPPGFECDAFDGVGSDCDDGLECTGRDTCIDNGGDQFCYHTGNTCLDDPGNCMDGCEEPLIPGNPHTCSGPADDNSYCTDNANPCDGTESCQSGDCASSGDPCLNGPDCNNECNALGGLNFNCYNSLGDLCTDDANECTTDQCDGAGTCENLAVADDQSCTDNGLFCDGSESCQSGNCASSGDPCDGSDADSDCSETCDEAADNCGANDPNGSTCPDNSVFCDGTESCQSGSCVGAGDPCAGGAECNGCNEGDESCLTPEEYPCTDDGDECTNDWCDGEGACVHPDLPGADVDNNGDLDNDDDGICDVLDNCYLDCNPDQADDDADCGTTGADPNACGDVCDVCPNFNEVLQTAEDAEECAAANYNIQLLDCCWPNDATAATTDPLCGPADDLILSVGGTYGPGDAPGGATIKIPVNCQDGETFSVTGESRHVNVTDNTDDPDSTDQYWADTNNRFISAFEFGPDGHTFDCGAGPLPVLCIDWVDDDDNGRLDKPPYAYGNTTFEKNIRMTWENAGEITRKCDEMEPCPVGSDLFPGWHPPTPADPNTRTDEPNENLGACCDVTENRLCVEVTGFSSFAIGTKRPPCTGSIGRAKLKVLKLHKEVGEQKIVLKGEVQLPTGEGSDGPDIDPIANGFQVVLREGSGATLWSADIPSGAFDNGSRTGWKSNKAGTVFNFKAKGRDDGVSKVVVKKAYGKQPGRVDVKVVAKMASVELDLEDLDTSGAPPPCESGCGFDASGCCPEPSIEGLWQGSFIGSGLFSISGPLDLDVSSTFGGDLAVEVDAAGFLFDGPASQACGEVHFLDAGGDGFVGSFNEDKTCASGTFTISLAVLGVSGTWEACRTTPLEEPLCERVLPLEAEVSLLGGDENRCGTTQFQDLPQRPFCAPNGSQTAIICR